VSRKAQCKAQAQVEVVAVRVANRHPDAPARETGEQARTQAVAAMRWLRARRYWD